MYNFKISLFGRTFLRMLLSKPVKKIWDMLDDPNDWKIDHYRLEHEDGLALWIANGHWFLDVVEGGTTKLEIVGLVDRHILWLKVRKYKILKRVVKKREVLVKYKLI